MAGKFSRTNFYRQNEVDNVTENDLKNNGFNSFEFKRPRTFFTVRIEHIGRLDLVSLRTLGKIDYWWIIAKVNNIDDLYNDMSEGQSLQIPAIADIDEFYVKTRRRFDI